MKKTLTWVSCDYREHGIDRQRDHAFTLRWEDGCVWIVWAGETIRSTIEKFANHGLDEWVKDPNGECEWDRVPRYTPTNHPEFLDRLGEYLDRQTSNAVEIILEVM